MKFRLHKVHYMKYSLKPGEVYCNPDEGASVFFFLIKLKTTLQMVILVKNRFEC